VLRRHRLQAGLTQERLAEATGLSRNYVSELELGAKSPSLRSIARLAAALTIRPHTLIQEAEGPER
jgi:transcriptional regulator with XRE-family HTH domain